jgi:hypothetical protein
MANDEHVALLKKGVAAWNEWRDENPGIDGRRTAVDAVQEGSTTSGFETFQAGSKMTGEQAAL